jgi:hypothetical protein
VTAGTGVVFSLARRFGRPGLAEGPARVGGFAAAADALA